MSGGTKKLSPRFDEALTFASRFHADQVRKGTGVPYISHLLAVASLVIEHGADEDEAIAALLHDAVEDQGGAEVREQIRARFGERVAEIVDGCSDADVIPKPPWRQRKEAHLAHLREASPSVRLVVAADKLHNARSVLMDYRALGPALWSRFRGGKDGTLWYYRAVVEALKAAGSGQMVEELERVVEEIEGMVRKETDLPSLGDPAGLGF